MNQTGVGIGKDPSGPVRPMKFTVMLGHHPRAIPSTESGWREGERVVSAEARHFVGGMREPADRRAFGEKLLEPDAPPGRNQSGTALAEAFRRPRFAQFRLA